MSIGTQSVYQSSVVSTRPADTTAYTANDVVGQDPAANMVFSGICGNPGSAVMITDITFEVDVAAVPTTMGGFMLHLFNAAPTPIADNAPYNLIAADREKYLDSIFIPCPRDNGDTLIARASGLNHIFQLASGSTTLWGMLETLVAFDPTSACVKKTKLTAMEV